MNGVIFISSFINPRHECLAAIIAHPLMDENRREKIHNRGDLSQCCQVKDLKNASLTLPSPQGEGKLSPRPRGVDLGERLLSL